MDKEAKRSPLELPAAEQCTPQNLFDHCYVIWNALFTSGELEDCLKKRSPGGKKILHALDTVQPPKSDTVFNYLADLTRFLATEHQDPHLNELIFLCFGDDAKNMCQKITVNPNVVPKGYFPMIANGIYTTVLMRLYDRSEFRYPYQKPSLYNAIIRSMYKLLDTLLTTTPGVY